MQPIDPTKLVIEPSLGKYRSEPGLFDDFLPQVLEDIQPQENVAETTQKAPTTIKLSIPIGVTAALAVPAAVADAPVPVIRPLPPPPPEPIRIPPPLPPSAPDPDSPTRAPPQQNEEPLDDDHREGAGAGAADQAGKELIVDDDIIVDQHGQEPRQTKRKAATEARNKIYDQTRFSNDLRYHQIPARKNQMKKLA